MPTNLLDYTGNAGLASGSSPEIPVSTTKDLDVINQTADRLQSQNAARNYQIFQSKIKDRDLLYKMLDEGTIKTGDILPQDRPRIQAALDKQTQAFMNWQKNGIQDTRGLMEYKKATQDAQLDATHAQARYVFDKNEQADLAKETLPRKQEARKANLDNVLSSFGNELKPYQHTLDFDFDPFKKYVEKETTETTDPKNPLMKVTKTTVSVPATMQQAQKDFLENGEIRESQTALLKEFQSMKPDELSANLTAMNNRLKPFGAEIKAHVNTETGQIVVDEKIPDFAAKWAMAADPQLTSATSKFDTGAANYSLGLKRVAETARHNKAMEGIDWAKFNYATDEDKFGASAVINEAKDILSKGEEVDVYDKSTGKKFKQLRIGDPNLLKTFGNVDKDGNVTNAPDFLEYDKNKNQVVLGYYGDDGRTIDREIKLDQRTWLKEIAKRSFPNKDIGKVNTLVDDILNDNGNSLFQLTEKVNKAETKSQPIQSPTKTKTGKYQLPKGQAKEVQQNGHTYIFNEGTGKYEPVNQ